MGRDAPTFGDIGEFFFGSTEAYGDPSDVVQLNPLTQQYYQEAMGAYGQYAPLMQEQLALAAGYDPTVGLDYFFQTVAPQLTGLVTGATAQYGELGQQYAQQLAQQGMREAAAQFGENVFSGAGYGAITEAGVTPLLQAQTQLAQTQAGLAGQLYGAGLQITPQQFQFQTQAQLEAAGIYGGLAQAGLGAAGVAAQPEWWQPTYIQDPGIFGSLAGLAPFALLA